MKHVRIGVPVFAIVLSLIVVSAHMATTRHVIASDADPIARWHHTLGDDHCPRYDLEPDDCEGTSVMELRNSLKLHDKTLSIVVSEYTKLSRFKSLLEASGLRKHIEAEGPFTIFAPNNAAFTGSFATFLEAPLEARKVQQLRQVIARHMVAGEITWEHLAGRKTVLTTLAGSEITIDGTTGLLVGRARVTH